MIRFIGGKDVINNMNIFKNIIIDNYGGIIDNTYNNTLYNNKLIIIVRPKQKFNNNEFNDIINYINNGGSLLILSNEGGDGLYNSNINYLLNNYDININNNTVIGTIHNNNYHPKEVIIKYNKYKFIYPYGCTLDNSNRDYNKILLNSGNLSYPINKPISIINNNGNGKICVIGSHMLFNDNYINKEDNTLLADIILKYLLNNTDKDYDNGMIEFNNNIYNNMNNISIPNTRLLADMLKSCLQHDQQYSTEQQQQQQLSGSGSGRVEGIYNNIMMDNLPIVLNTYNKLIRSIGGKSGGYIVNGGGKYNNNTKRVLSVIKPHFITINGLINNTYKFTSSPALIPPLLYNIYNNGESGHHQQQQQQQSMDNNNQYHHQQQYHQPNLEMYDLEDELSSYSQRLNTLIINKYNNIIQFDENNNNIGNFIKDACSSINDDNMIMRSLLLMIINTNNTTTTTTCSSNNNNTIFFPTLNKDAGAFEFEQRYQRTEKKPLGEGTYGEVYKARCQSTGLIVAMKRMKLDQEDEGVPSTAIREVSLLKELKHTNIVKLLDVFCSHKKLYLIFEFVDLDLKKHMKQIGGLTKDKVQSFAYQLLLGTNYCHEYRIIHRDLKPQNLLIDSNGTLKLADFGLARAFSLPIPKYTHEVVTVWYRAPEILLGSSKYSIPIDNWSVGCILAEMATNTPLFPGDSEIDTIFRIFRKLGTPNESIWCGIRSLPDFKDTFPQWRPRGWENIPGLMEKLGEAGCDLLSMFLTYNPADRLSCKRGLEHPYFATLDKKQFNYNDDKGIYKISSDDDITDIDRRE